MSNSISFVGRLAADAELKTAGSSKVLEFRLCCNTGFGDRQVASWFKCCLWGARGEKIANMLHKGNQIFIAGELTLREYTAKDGAIKTSAEINVQSLDFIGKKNDAGEQPSNSEDDRQATKPATPAATPAEDSTDELPF